MKNLNNLTNHLGYIYSFPVRIGGWVLALVGALMLIDKGWGLLFGSVLALIGLYFATAATGICINIKEKAVLNYSSFLGIRRGSWRDFPTYKYICVIRKNLDRKSFFKAVKHDAEASYKFEVYLVSRSFRGKALLDILYNREDAEFKAQRYAEEMNLSVVEYQSPGHKKSKARTGIKS